VAVKNTGAPPWGIAPVEAPRLANGVAWWCSAINFPRSVAQATKPIRLNPPESPSP
jgi:hypothetical protein